MPDFGAGPPAPSLVSLAIVILSFGRTERFRPLVDGLLAAGISAGDMLVMHNPYGPEDTWVPTAPDGVGVRRMPTNVGYAAAMNRGIDELADRASAVLLLTHDTRLAPDAVSLLSAAIESAPEYGVLAPALEFDGSGSAVAYGSRVSASGIVAHVTSPPAVDDRGVADAAWVDGCAMLVRVQALRDAGPLRADFFMYFEEADLCDRVREAGWRVGVVPAARARSEPGGGRRPAAYGYLFARNGVHWSRSHGGRRLAASFALRQLSSSWRDLPKPGGRRFRSGQLRRQGVQLAAGRCVGLIAGALGRAGPPPPLFARKSDMHDSAEDT
jgi:N-acetylglucosaminyl-diphospho-decaprenol L-rhamnosyltransferase